VEEDAAMVEAQLDTDCIAPCGINCLLCYRHLCAKPCPGCRREGEGKPEHCKRCRIKACALAQGYTHCHECPSFPCRPLAALDRRYRVRYGVSPRDDGLAMRAGGIEAFLRGQLKRYACEACGGMVCMHTRVCAGCGTVVCSESREVEP
jgi:hypothetical protein